ncbi:MAG TPA: cohesin domain-containing protein [Candidatus Saccharimonadales bacterium]|nr:cohesin domain-containing protein [Candidatus Saccharimonadales bacterium]
MSKKLLAIIIVFLIIVGGFIFVNTVYLKDSKPQIILVNKNLKNSALKTSLYFNPNLIMMTASQSAQVDIELNHNQAENNSKLIQLEISYDPTILYNVRVMSGNYLTNPDVILNNIDSTTGRISYALKSDFSNPNSKILATIHFNALNLGFEKQTKISFLPKTLMRFDEETVKIDSMNGAQIIIKPAVFQYLPASSQSATLTP